MIVEDQVGCRKQKKAGCIIFVGNHLRHFLERNVGPFQREEFAGIEWNCSGVVGTEPAIGSVKSMMNSSSLCLFPIFKP